MFVILGSGKQHSPLDLLFLELKRYICKNKNAMPSEIVYNKEGNQTLQIKNNNWMIVRSCRV